MYVCHYFSIVATIISMLFKMQHWPYQYELVITAVSFSLVFCIFAIVELIKLKASPPVLKYSFMGWTAAMLIGCILFYLPIAAIILQWLYLYMTRKKLYSPIPVTN